MQGLELGRQFRHGLADDFPIANGSILENLVGHEIGFRLARGEAKPIRGSCRKVPEDVPITLRWSHSGTAS